MPTVRALMRYHAEPIAAFDLSSLRVIATVGEPINPAAWEWYYHNVGRGRCSLVDTFWQTETGGHVGANLPGAVLRMCSRHVGASVDNVGLGWKQMYQ